MFFQKLGVKRFGYYCFGEIRVRFFQRKLFWSWRLVDEEDILNIVYIKGNLEFSELEVWNRGRYLGCGG